MKFQCPNCKAVYNGQLRYCPTCHAKITYPERDWETYDNKKDIKSSGNFFDDTFSSGAGCGCVGFVILLIILWFMSN